MNNSIELLDGVWEAVHKAPQYKHLTIQICQRKITAKDQFFAYYRNCFLLFDNKVDAENMFFMILTGNDWLINQLKNKKDWLEGLGNLDIWCDVEDFTSTTNNVTDVEDSSSSTNQIKLKGKVINSGKDESGTKNKTGTSDASSYDEELNDEYLEVDNLINIPANNMVQAQTIATSNSESKSEDSNTTDSTNKSEAKGKNTNVNKNDYQRKSSNSSEDYREILALEISDLTNRLWNKFGVMFATHG